MSTALRIAAVFAALCAGVFLAALLVFGGPNYYGLRPHAVDSDLETHDVRDLTALAQYGRVTGVLTYDAWYKGRDGATGWFLLRPEQTEGVGFKVNGALDPTIARVFGAAPRRCKNTPHPEKMIRAIEPARAQSGFLGRSTCRRSKMDIAEVIAASTPALRHNDFMTHAELARFDAQNDPLVLREHVNLWPTPYAYHRTISLPIVWEALNDSYGGPFETLKDSASSLADALHRDGFVGVRLMAQDWRPRHISDALPDHLPFVRDSGTVMLSGIRFTRFYFTMLCAPEAREACDAVDVSELLPEVMAARNPDTLATVLSSQTTYDDSHAVQRDILREASVTREGILSPTSAERRFDVVWYDAREVLASE